jgi:SLOG family YspA-like protein
MRILVCGSRSWLDMNAILEQLKLHTAGVSASEVELIHGNAAGADVLGAAAGAVLGFKIYSYPADWRKYGRAAGLIRNKQMLEAKPDLVLAFWDGESRGTRDMIRRAECARVHVEITRIGS